MMLMGKLKLIHGWVSSSGPDRHPEKGPGHRFQVPSWLFPTFPFIHTSQGFYELPDSLLVFVLPCLITFQSLTHVFSRKNRTHTEIKVTTKAAHNLAWCGGHAYNPRLGRFVYCKQNCCAHLSTGCGVDISFHFSG
jgi:hypothetical protein